VTSAYDWDLPQHTAGRGTDGYIPCVTIDDDVEGFLDVTPEMPAVAL
jgi:hypothetical protein